MTPIIGHWTVDGVPACSSSLTIGVTFDDGFGSEWPTYCACTEDDYRLMSTAVLAKHPEARCEWHAASCPGYERDREADAERREAEETRWRGDH